MIHYKIDGYDKLMAGLKTGSETMAKSFQNAINKIGLIVQRDIKSFTPVRTGRLQKGNQLKLGPLTAMIYNKVEYGPYVHAKKPFMTQGFEHATPEINKILEDEVSSILKVITK